ncbi:MAG TPA: twin-arginine translocation signal domain-containing protein, partial [Gemmatimonadales bacterium]|nr:twin-arginine translocation signal domain-containing protein [Gemmatimonadales bacterium]
MPDLSRREFLSTAAVAGAALNVKPHGAPVRQPTLPPDSPAALPPAFELDEATIADLQAGMRSGKYSSRQLTELYLGRIAAMDRQGPSLHAMLDLNPDAL